MATRKIYIVDKPEELAFLRKISKPVDEFNARLGELLDDMKDTMKKADGAGLSAVQVGILKRVFIILSKDDVVEFVNPQILEASGECPIMEEGCLSIPGRYGRVKRPNKVVIKAQDRFGNEFVKTFTGFEAKAVAHENDHLDGILYTDIEIKKEKRKK